MPAEITVTFPFDLDEWAKASRQLLARGPGRTVSLLFGGGGALLAVWATVSSLRSGAGAAAAVVNSLPWLILSAFWAFGLTGMILLQQKRMIRKKMPSVTGEQVRTFSETGFYYATPEMAQHFAWSAIQKVVETDEFILVFVAPGAGHYVPKHAIPVESEERLRQLLSSVFAGRAKALLLRTWAA